MVEQQAELGDGAPFIVPGLDSAQIGQIVVVQGDDVGEAAEVRRRHLPALIAGDIDPMFARHGLGARIGRMADMPVPRAGGLDDQVETQTLGLGAEGGLGEGRQMLPRQTKRMEGMGCVELIRRQAQPSVVVRLGLSGCLSFRCLFLSLLFDLCERLELFQAFKLPG